MQLNDLKPGMWIEILTPERRKDGPTAFFLVNDVFPDDVVCGMVRLPEEGQSIYAEVYADDWDKLFVRKLPGRPV